MDVALAILGAWALAMLGWALWPAKARTFHGPTQERVRWRRGKLRAARKRAPKGEDHG